MNTVALFVWIAANVHAAKPVYRVMIENLPQSINPRYALDANGQRLASLVFRGLTQISSEARAVGDLASDWKASADTKVWTFNIRPNLTDPGGKPITPQELMECFANYKESKPTASIILGFNSWSSLKLKNRNQLEFTLEGPDPFFMNNINLLRFFRSEAGVCRDPKQNEILQSSGPFVLKEYSGAKAVIEGPNYLLRFEAVRDDSTQMSFARQGVFDLLPNVIPFSKTRFLEREKIGDYQFVQWSGTSVSYLAFNNEDPILKDARVRQAIAHAIPREDFVKYKMFGMGELATSLLHPRLKDHWGRKIEFDLKRAESLLDEAEFRRDKKTNFRFRLKYKTTPAREGQEPAIIIREYLRRIGVDVVLEVLEPSLFQKNVREGRYQIAMGRWVGIIDSSILFRTLHSKQKLNRARYSNPEMDAILDAAINPGRPGSDSENFRKAQEILLRDLPYFPLWHWANSWIIKENLAPPKESERSVTGRFDSLAKLETR